MPQTFTPATALAVRLVGLVIGATAVALVVVGLRWVPPEGRPVHGVTPQPIPFSHKHHVGDVGLDCRFCHVTVERTAAAGLPSAQLCLTCHSQLFAEQTLLAPLRHAVATARPIAWARVNRLPDYVYFDHSVHLAKGVACAECHGRVDQMPLMSKPQPMTMRWCMACHEAPAAHLHAPADVTTMPPPPTTQAQRQALAQRLEPLRRRTDCSTCHR